MEKQQTWRHPNIGKTDETGPEGYNGLPNDCRQSAPEQFEVKFHENANFHFLHKTHFNMLFSSSYFLGMTANHKKVTF